MCYINVRYLLTYLLLIAGQPEGNVPVIWNNAVIPLKFSPLLSQICSVCTLRRNSTVCTLSFPQSGHLSGY